MTKDFRYEDCRPISSAPALWWKSQRIRPHHAAYIMAGVAGGIVGGMIADNKEQLKEGVDLLVNKLRRAAAAAFVGNGR